MISQVSREAFQITKRQLLDLFEAYPGRIDLLSDQDKMLISLFMASEKFTSIASAAGVHEATIARRLKKIAKRLKSDSFVMAMKHRLAPEKMEILRKFFLEGMSMLKIATQKNLPYSRIRRIIKAYKRLIRIKLAQENNCAK